MAAPDDGALARMAVHAHLHGNLAPGIDERTGLACTYSLVTERTNFLLTLERAPGEKAQDMPELQRVAQMLPAGWGGTGSVVLRSGTLPSMPAVWRREAASEGIRMAQRQAPYDLPVMFRRAVDNDLRPSMHDDVPKRSRLQRIAAFWRSDVGPGHLTPLALHRLLVSTPCDLWDRSYADLLAANIDPALVDWLRNSFGASHPEEAVVASFLCCMAQPAMRRTLAGRAALPYLAVRTLAGWTGLSRRHARMPHKADAALAARMAQDLAGITADNWPPSLLVPGLQGRTHDSAAAGREAP